MRFIRNILKIWRNLLHNAWKVIQSFVQVQLLSFRNLTSLNFNWVFKVFQTILKSKNLLSWLNLFNVQKYWDSWMKSCQSQSLNNKVRKQYALWITGMLLIHPSRSRLRKSGLKKLFQLHHQKLVLKNKRVTKRYPSLSQIRVASNYHL